jgi:PAS domain S-box-containing protein
MIWGKNLKEGDSMLEYANPANREAFEKNFGIALQGKCISSERHLHYPNGQSIWYEIHYIPVLSQQGQVEAVVFTGLDITKQKEDENIVKKLSLVAQKTSNMVVITDKNGLTEWVNEGFVRITGYSLQEAQGKTPGQLLQGPLSDQSTIDYMSECRQRGERFEAEIVNYRKDGTPYWLSISASPVYAENAGLTGFIAIQSDITEKKTLQAQTIQHLSTLNAILSSSKDGICALDTSYRYLTFNEVYANNIKKMFGIELQVGMDALETLTANENFAHVKKDWDRALRGESLRKEETLKISDEEVVYLEVSFNPIFKNQKEIMGVAIFIKDITMHKQAEKHLLRQNEQLQKINEQLDKFVYRAGHDLRAPLVSVLGLINIAQLETDASAKDAYMEMMKKSIAKLDHFIQDIIYFSRNSRTTLSYDQISFEPFMDDILAALMHTREEKPIEFRVDIRQEEEFYSDSKRLSVVLNNLIANAIKYSNPYKETPYVAIQVSVTSEQAFISISDNGIGIEKEHIGRIFDMFYRATETKSGSGLGLSIVKETLEKLGGRIQVESQWGEGTRFTLEVPNRYRKN